MKKRIARFITIIIIGAGLFGIGYKNGLLNSLFRINTIRAFGDLVVDFGVPLGTPLFYVDNMLPGDSVEKTVKVTNNGTKARKVSVKAVKTDEIDNLAGVLEIVISKSGIDLYGGNSTTGSKTLAQFFIDSVDINGVYLSDLPKGQSVNYTFRVYFKETSGNEYQQTKVVFDLTFGIIIDIPIECQGLKFTGKLIEGTQSGDILYGTAGNDLILGYGGGDIIYGRAGDDCIVGGGGGDNLYGEDDNDIILGQDGGDNLFGGIGNDKLYGGTGNDNLSGGPGDDYLDARPGQDNAQGDSGSDTCFAQIKKSCEK